MYVSHTGKDLSLALVPGKKYILVDSLFHLSNNPSPDRTVVIPSRRQLMKHAAKVFDLCALVTSFVLATAALYPPPEGMTFAGFMAMRIKLGNSLLFGLLLVTWHSLFILCGLYVSKRLIRRRTQIFEVLRATSLVAAFLLVSAKVFKIQMVTFKFVLIFWAVCTCLVIVGRLGSRSLLLALRRRGRNTRFVLIVGTNKRATEFARQIVEQPELGYRILGFVDDDWSGFGKFETTGYARCCTFSGLADFLRHNVVDEAAIYLPLRSYYEHAAQLVSLCELHGIVIRFDSQIFNLRISQAQTQGLEANSQGPVAGSAGAWPALAKRVLDCVFSALLLILFAPLFFVVAVLVKWTSHGTDLFPPDPRRSKQTAVQDIQIQNNDCQCRTDSGRTRSNERDDRSGIQDKE